jgi:hypothetical protein
MIGYNNKFVASTPNTKFLWMSMNETLPWDNHIEALAKKLSMACYIIRSTKIYMSITSLKIIYYAFFHSLMIYGIIFWETPHLVPQFFAYRRKQFELLKDVRTVFHVETCLGNSIFYH